MTYVVTRTAAPDVYLISERATRKVVAKIIGQRSLADAMCAAAEYVGAPVDADRLTIPQSDTPGTEIE